jgi:hypothetical protein
MDAELERRLAHMLVERAALLEECASTDGVLAYLRRPPQRERPNERFLKNTLRGVFSSNQRAQVDKMWELRDAQLEREARRRKRDDVRHYYDITVTLSRSIVMRRNWFPKNTFLCSKF